MDFISQKFTHSHNIDIEKMAGNDDESDSQSSKSVEIEGNIVKNIVKCCGKVVKVVVCVRCHGLHHISCAKRQNSTKFINSSMVTCCDNKQEQEEEESLPSLNLKNEKLAMENQLLKQIIEELREKNELLKQNNGLLLEKIETIQVKNRRETYVSVCSRETTAHDISGAANYSASLSNAAKKSNRRDRDGETPARRDAAVRNPGVGTSDSGEQGSSGTLKNGTNELQLQNTSQLSTGYGGYGRNNRENKTVYEKEVKESRRGNESATVNNQGDDGKKPPNESEWKTFMGRRRRSRKTLGENEEENAEFIGVRPKLWLYVNRVCDSVSEEMIVKYLKEKTDSADKEFIVKMLGSKDGQKSFVVTADMKFKEALYSPSFWPAGVGYRRYNFRENKQPGNNPAAFLEVE